MQLKKLILKLISNYDVSMFDATETQIEEAQWNYINMGNN